MHKKKAAAKVNTAGWGRRGPRDHLAWVYHPNYNTTLRQSGSPR